MLALLRSRSTKPRKGRYWQSEPGPTRRSSRPTTAGFARFRRRLSLNVRHLRSTVAPQEYEDLVQRLAAELTSTVRAEPPYTVRGGRSNRVPGRSDFPHQIDVTVHNSTFLLLIECKHWRKAIGASPLLVLASRLADIRSAHPGVQVQASVASTKAPSKGATVLAAHFGIDLHAVVSHQEYALRISTHYFLGLCDTAHGSDSIAIEKRRAHGA